MVYVDNASIPFGRMKMSHMIADTTEELLAMADILGVKLRWLQYARTSKEHFDICASKRLLAILAGAIPITSRELGVMIMERIKAVNDTVGGSDANIE